MTSPLDPSNRACKNTCKQVNISSRASYIIDPAAIVALQQQVATLQNTVNALIKVITGTVGEGTCEGQTLRYNGTSYEPDGTDNINIGCNTTKAGAGDNTIQIGFSPIVQGIRSIAIGHRAGVGSQADDCVAIGFEAGGGGQASSNIAIGYQAGLGGQNFTSIAIGRVAGQAGQGISCIAIGSNAAQFVQADECVALGSGSGQHNQGLRATALGHHAGNRNQAAQTTAVGKSAGRLNQFIGATALGYESGYQDQGIYAVSIGNNAGRFSQGDRSIVINATGAILNNFVANTCVIAPIRNAGVGVAIPANIPPGGHLLLAYDNTTKEVFAYSPT